MKKICRLSKSAFTAVFLFASFNCLAIDYGPVSEGLNRALKLRAAGDIDGARMSLEEVLSIIDTVDAVQQERAAVPEEQDLYTKEYLQSLIACLKGDERVYLAVIKHIMATAKKTSELFGKIAEELKQGELSAASAQAIKEMELEMARVSVTHSFSVPPEGYTEVYNLTQEILFYYSAAWKNLELISSGGADEPQRLQAEALLNFQRGNELFSRASELMLAIPNR